LLKVEFWRQERKWTLRELAAISGVSRSVLGDIKLGTKLTLTHDQEIKLSKAFDISISDLYEEEKGW